MLWDAKETQRRLLAQLPRETTLLQPGSGRCLPLVTEHMGNDRVSSVAPRVIFNTEATLSNQGEAQGLRVKRGHLLRLIRHRLDRKG